MKVQENKTDIIDNNRIWIFLPEEEMADEVVIILVEKIDENEEIYTSVKDTRVDDIVFELFKERSQDFFKFID